MPSVRPIESALSASPDAPQGAVELTKNPLSWEHSTSFLKLAIKIILIGELIYLAIIIGFYPEQWQRILGLALLLATCLIGWLLIAIKLERVAVNFLAAGVWLSITLVAFINGGIRAPIDYAYPLLIILTGWLISPGAAIFISALTCVTLMGMIAAAWFDWLPHPAAAPLVLFGVVQVVICILSAVMVYFLVKSYRNRLLELSAVTNSYALRTAELETIRSELFQAQAVAKVGSWVFDMANDRIRMTDQVCKIFGLPEGAHGTAAAYLEMCLEEDRPGLKLAWKAALEGEAFDHDHRIRVDRATRWVRQRAQIEFDSNGQPLRAVGTSQDITRRKLADLALQQSEKRFSTAFRSSPVAFSITTADRGLILEANDNFERDFGWSRDDLLGRYAVEVGLWPNAQSRQTWVDAILKTGRVRNHETVWIHKNGERRDISLSGEVIEIDGQRCFLVYSTDITERKRADAQIQKLAFFDPLTQLPNRRLLMDRLTQALVASTRHPSLGALLFLDLDNFKTLNDTHGHDKGDLLLQQVAQRLKACVREADTVARLGGDEFVVMLDDLSENTPSAASQAENVGEKILFSLNQPYQLGSITQHTTPSIGITLFGASQETIEEPLKRADLAMYQAKAAGRNTICFFDPAMQAVVDARMGLEIGIRQALEEQQFFLQYQPQVHANGAITGAEVLVRWQHPKRGMVSPAEFIPLAEETGLILPLGQWVLETACRQLQAWSLQADLAHLTLAVNVSSRQFHQSDFVTQVLGTLTRTGAKPAGLKLELTESLLVSNINDVIEKMSELKRHGVGFSLDDFGTGYSSLSYLKRLPLDQLKIDQSFVRDILEDPNDAAIAQMVIVLAQTLGLQVIAEGVETLAQKDALLAQGCQAYQGYLFSRPVPVQSFEAYARKRAVQAST